MNGLRQKILFLILTPVCIVLVVIGGMAIYNKNSSENQLLFDRFNSYRVLLENGDLSFDTIRNRDKLETLLNEKVDLAEILRSDYSVVYTSENSAAPLITNNEKKEVDDAFLGMETIKDIVKDGRSFFSIITPLVVNGNIVAVLHQVISNVESSTRVNQYAFYIIFLMLGGLGICFVTIFVLLSQIILNNIYKLKQAAIEIQNGNLDIETSIEAKDEIGDLAAAFGQMAGELKKSRKEMQDYNKKLESEVASRTKDLKVIEEKLKTVNFDLEDKVKERTVELEKLKNNLEDAVAQRTSSLNMKMDELERMNKFMVDREIKMVELKKKIDEYEKKGIIAA